jgi:hypothetical protein
MKLLTRRFAWMPLCFLSVAYATAHAQNARAQGIEATAAEVPVSAYPRSKNVIAGHGGE